ncbi:MAG: DPP IV N-terminal domain-containing protein, partial [Bacteroidota bacterium]
MKRMMIFLFLLFSSFSSSDAQAKRALQLSDLFAIQRVSDPQLSPDGKAVAFVVGAVDKDANRTNSDIWLIPTAGGDPKQLTNAPKADRHPRWSPDGKWIAFESNRNGSLQIYIINVATGETKQVTNIFSEASGAIWSPDGKKLGFISAVFPEFSDKPFAEADALNKQQQEARDNSKMKARVMTKLLYRHWDSWVDDKRQHIFVVNADGTDPKNVTPGDRDAVPPSSTFSTGDDFTFSPDGKEIAYTATPVPVHEESWSTNHDILTVTLATGERKQITTNTAADVFPQYSPNGKYIAYRAQSRTGFEADRWQLMLYDRAAGTTKSLTPNFDTNVDAFTWANDNKTIYTSAEEKANTPLWSITIDGTVKKVFDNAANGDVNVSADGKTLVFSHQTMSRPVELWTANSTGANAKQLTHVNDALFAQIEMSTPEYVWFDGANGTKVQMWIVKPPFFDAAKKYPLVY